jgi:hypothetical protein
VDAVKRAWRVFRGLVFERWVVVCLLALFYIPMLFLAPYYNGKPLAVLMAFFPAGAMGLLATERVIKYCIHCAQLGVPRYIPSVRLAQALVVTVFAIVPGALSIVRGAPALPVAALLLGALAFGTLVAMNPPSFFAIFLVATPGGGRSFMAEWLAIPAVQGAVVLLSLYQLLRWWRLPELAAARGLQAVGPLADVGHERPAARGQADPGEGKEL